MPSSQEVFDSAVRVVQAMPREGPVKSSNDEKLAFYSLFKQATLGPCSVGKPGFWNVVEGYKWQAWHDLGEMSREEAMDRYVERLQRKIDIVNEHHNTGDWMRQAGEHTEKFRRDFDLIGRPLSSFESDERHEKLDESLEILLIPSENVDDNEGDEQTRPREGTHRPESSCNTENVTSDTEYCDAEEDNGVISRISRVGSGAVIRRTRQQNPPEVTVDRSVLQQMQRDISSLTEQVRRLTSLLDERQNILVDFVRKTNVHLFGSSRIYGLSWKSTIFFLIWPFIVHYFLKYRRLIMMIPSLLQQ